MNTFIIKNVNIVTEYGIINNGFLYVKRGIIRNIGKSEPGKVHRSCSIVDGKGGLLMPGFIDISNDQLARIGDSTFHSVEKTLYSHGITSVFHMIPGYNAMEDNRLNQLRRLGVIRHQFLTKMPMLNSYHIVSAPVLCSEAPILKPDLTAVQGQPFSNPILSDMANHPSVYIICSDSMESPILQCIHAMVQLFGVRLEEAVGMASINPARALGLDVKLGSVEWGKKADLILADYCDDFIDVSKVFVSGCLIYDRDEPKIIEECNTNLKIQADTAKTATFIRQ